MQQPEPHRRLRQIIWFFARIFIALTFVPILRLQVKNWRLVPRKGGVLLLANHTTFFDPILVSWATQRRTHGVGTDQILRVPIFGKIVPWLSVISFAKGMKDRAAMTKIGHRIQDGGVVLIFPEGNRSWTGRIQPIKESTGRLAKRLDCPVVCCQVTTAYYHWPRWASYPRLVPIKIEFLPPRRYPAEMSDAEVTADIVQQIAVDPNTVPLPKWSWGFRLAWGLPAFLWACPTCFVLGGIDRVDNSRIGCRECGAVWRVDMACRLHAENAATDTTVDLAYYGILEHFGACPVADPGRFTRDGEVLSCAHARIELVHCGVTEPEVLGEGTMTLYDDRLVFSAIQETGSFTLSYGDVQAVLMQIGSRLQARTAEMNYQLKPSSYGISLWEHFLSAHVRRYRQGASDAS